MNYKEILDNQRSYVKPKMIFSKASVANVTCFKSKNRVVIGDVASEVKKTKKPKRNSYDIKGYAKKAMEQNSSYKKSDNNDKFYIDMDKVKQNIIVRKHKRR